MDWDSLLKRSTLAGIVACGIVVGGLAYCAVKGETDFIIYAASGALVWLFKEVKDRV